LWVHYTIVPNVDVSVPELQDTATAGRSPRAGRTLKPSEESSLRDIEWRQARLQALGIAANRLSHTYIAAPLCYPPYRISHCFVQGVVRCYCRATTSRQPPEPQGECGGTAYAETAGSGRLLEAPPTFLPSPSPAFLQLGCCKTDAIFSMLPGSPFPHSPHIHTFFISGIPSWGPHEGQRSH
jgi:hypothetical protein